MPGVVIGPHADGEFIELVERPELHDMLRVVEEQYGGLRFSDAAADHDVMKMRDDKIRVVNVDVDADRREKQAGQAADREEADKSERVEHGRVVRDRSAVQRGGPVEDLDRR